ncbi:MAG: tetratricopeptide repeat protein [Deltaproteobacteria bacterium]|nr:tetratricopeptide repeat protein [Deltaproteobacteria bacterium]
MKASTYCIFVIACLLWIIPSPAADMGLKNRIKIKKKSQLSVSSSENSEEYTLEKIEVLGKKRKNLILDIRRFVREAKDPEQKAELNLRLAALHMEDYYAGLAKTQQTYERELAEHAKIKNNKKPLPKLDNSEAIAALDKARSIYKDLVNRYPNHPRRDEMLYSLSVASLDKGQTTEGMSTFQQLTEQYPHSRYLNDAFVQLGDHYFDSNQFAKSEPYYDKIIQRKYAPLVPYATYKKAWCAYNTGRTSQALQSFRWVIQNEDLEDRSAPIRIKNEALRDITLPFVDLKLVSESIAFFRTYGDTQYRKGLETMASLYFEAGDYRDSITMWQTLLELDANHPKNPEYDLSIVDSMKLKNEAREATDRLFARLPGYLENSNWYELNAPSPKVVKEAQQKFEETARKYAFEYHAQGQKTKNESLYTLARNLYEKYLEFFSASAFAAQVRFYLAEILFRQQVYIGAADHYYRVYKEASHGSLKLDGIRYSIASLERETNIERKKQGLAEISSKSSSKLKENDSTQFVPYSDVENKFIRISAEFLSTYPSSKEAPDVLYHQAYLHYVHRDLAKAYKSFWNFVTTYSGSPSAYHAAYLILDILNRRQDYTKLVAASQRFLNTSALSRSSFRTEVADILRRAELKRIQAIETKGNFREAGQAYLNYTRTYGSQDEALFEKALYNASVNFTKAEMTPQALEAQEKFLRRFPKSPLRENMLLQVAKTYEMLAQFDKAAVSFEQFATQYPSNSQAKNALRLSGLYYWGSGNSARAEGVMLLYLSKHSDGQLVEKDLFDLYESSGALDKEIAYFFKKRSTRGITPSNYVADTLTIAELQAQKTGKIPTRILEEAFITAGRHPSSLKDDARGAEAFSKLLFWSALKKEETFQRIQLSERNLEGNLKHKLAVLKELEAEYLRLAQLKTGDWGLGALYRTALLYQNMAKEVFAAPVPSVLTAEQVELYRAEINKTFIKPFSEKALGLAMQCLDKSQELNLISQWTPKCYSVAGELEPKKYPKVRTFYLPPLQTALMMPLKESSKIEIGPIKKYAFPFYSTALFSPLYLERTPSMSSLPGSLFFLDESKQSESAIPMGTTYKPLSEERRGLLLKEMDEAKPNKHGSSFAYLNLLRLVSPGHATGPILESIQQDPQNIALHNLFALAQMETGNLAAAKVTWLSLIARGFKNAAIWNNLGVVTMLEGKETQAIQYFQEASLLELPKEATVNLGFIALKYRNGFEAKKYFEQALALGSEDATLKVGLAVAQLQNRELDKVRESLVDLATRYKEDPYARLSLGYLLMDVEKEPEAARRVLTEYVEQQSLESDLQFRQALQETRSIQSSTEELPSVGN